MIEPTTAQSHPFVFDMLAGWTHQIGDERYSEAYHQVAYDLYQKAGAETVSWGDGEPPFKDMSLREQFEWLQAQLPGVIEKLAALEGAVHTPAEARGPGPEREWLLAQRGVYLLNDPSGANIHRRPREKQEPCNKFFISVQGGHHDDGSRVTDEEAHDLAEKLYDLINAGGL